MIAFMIYTVLRNRFRFNFSYKLYDFNWLFYKHDDQKQYKNARNRVTPPPAKRLGLVQNL